MKTNFKYISGLLVVAFLTLGSCTSDFEEMNIDERRVTDEQLEADYYKIGGFFPQLQQMIYCNFNWGWGVNWPFQIMQNLNADIFSGYLMTPTAFRDNVNNTTYSLSTDWNSSMWNYTYAYFMTAENNVERLTEQDYPNFYATALILKVQAMHRVSDLYGPIIYTNYGDSKTGSEFDSQKDAYYAFFEDLDNAAQLLGDFVNENPDARPFAKYDQMFEGDYTKWIKYANSLRLRLAIHIANVDPAKAKAEAEAAMANPFGVLETDIAQVSGKGYTNPLNAIANSWHDIKMGGVMESILSGYNDPRISAYFTPSTDEDVIAAGYEYKGIRQGIELKDKATYSSHSSVNFTPETPGILLTPAEVYLLRAEGVVRGWSNMGGTAQELYEAGIQASMDQWSVKIGDYLSNTNTAAPYVDAKRSDDVNNIEEGNQYLNNVTPAWDEGATTEEKYAKISTQKWIAIFPEGVEAWTEVRRTGYPKIFPIVVNNSGGALPSEHFIRRINFSIDERDANPEGYKKAVELLGGPDYGSTSLWWDVD